MTNEELRQIVCAVIVELQSNGINVNQLIDVGTTADIDKLIALKTDGSVVSISPSVFEKLPNEHDIRINRVEYELSEEVRRSKEIDDGHTNDFMNLQMNLSNEINRSLSADQEISAEMEYCRTQVDSMGAKVNSMQKKVDDASSQVDELIYSKNMPGGFPTLTDDMTLSDNVMPIKFNEVLEFVEFVDYVFPLLQQGLSKTSDDIDIVFDRTRGLFVAKVMNDSTRLYNYYNTWGDGRWWGSVETNGHKPYSGKIYVNKADGKAYRWDGEQMVVVGTEIVAKSDAELEAMAASGQLKDGVLYLGIEE